MENSEDFFDFAPSAQVQQQHNLVATTKSEDIFPSVNSDNNETSANYSNSCAADNLGIKVEQEEDFTIKMEDEKDELGPILGDYGTPSAGQIAEARFRARCNTWPRHYLEGH